MSKIEQIILEANFEIARSQIAIILTTELAGQKLLNETALSTELAKPIEEQDPVLIAQYRLNIESIPSIVWEERFFRPTQEEIIKEPIINVIFTNAPLNELITVSTQSGTDRFVVEFYTGSKSKESGSGDKLASIKLQRIQAICRAILMSPHYQRLNMDVAGESTVTDIQIDQPSFGADDSSATIYGKLDVNIKLPECVEQIEGVLLEQNDTVMKLNDSEKGYYWTSGDLQPEFYNLTTIAEEGGSIIPEYTNQPIIPNTEVLFAAFPYENFKFDKFQVDEDGTVSEVFANPFGRIINSITTVIAKFIQFFTLNISSVGNGSTVPVAGSYEVEEGETFKIEAFPDANNQFDNFDDNGTIITDNPYFSVMDSDKLIVANFRLNKINDTYGVIDPLVSDALNASSKLLDVVMIGDSNQLLGGNGWDLSIDKVLTDKYGMYGTALISANENNGNGANQGYEYNRLNGGLIGQTTGQPEPFASMWKGISYNLPSFLDTGETVPPVKNNALIILRDCPIGVNNELTFRVNYANFSSGGGTLYPRVRLEESPYSNQTPIETVECTGADEMTCYDLVMPAAVRDKHISCKFAYAETLNGKLFIPFTHAFRTGATSGVAAHSLIAQGGASLEQMLELLEDSTLEQTSYYFYAIRERQMDLGQVVPNIVVRINSGLNDRNQIDSTKATYKARLQSIIDRIIAVWDYKGWDLDELSFIITPSHRISDPDDTQLIEYREAAREICLVQPRCAMADFGELMTYQEALDNGWYLNGNDTSHLDVLGSETCASREMDTLII